MLAVKYANFFDGWDQRPDVLDGDGLRMQIGDRGGLMREKGLVELKLNGADIEEASSASSAAAKSSSPSGALSASARACLARVRAC